MHNYSTLEEEIGNAVWFFTEVEKLRTSCDRRLTHLAKRRKCLACLDNYYPRIAKTKCPDCDGKLRSAQGVMTCPNCGYKAGELGCTHCREKDRWEANPKDDPYVRIETVPSLRILEEKLEGRVIELVRDHPLWEWAKDIKGVGETTIGRVISCCDIERCTTLSKFYAHYGQGLRPDGTIQRKSKGVKLDYDPQAQSIAYMLAKCLQSQVRRDKETKEIVETGKYYDFFVDWKEEYHTKELSDGVANSRAFRNMRKLALSHIYEVWRKGVGLPYSEPYAYTILVPPHAIENKVSPWQMGQPKPTR